MKNRVIRFGPPSHLDSLPQGSECVVIKKNSLCDVYVQQARDEERPDWELIDQDVKIENVDDRELE